MVGRLLHYEIVGKLGEGGMGVVYKARDTHLNRFVAIKVLPPNAVADPLRKARFVQEAKAASALNHPNIITIYDVSSDGRQDFIAMEYVTGRTLAEMIARRELRFSEVLRIGAQIADALAAAHAAGIVHRDLKPANVMVDERGLVKVLDFGLAKLTERAVSTETATATMSVHTEAGTIVGTAAYMSPEQAQGRKVDRRSDIFSFGVLLYEALSNRRPFQGDSNIAILSAILLNEPPPLDAGSPELERIVRRCLRKDPELRVQHFDDLKLALLELKDESESGRLQGRAKSAPHLSDVPRKWYAVGSIVVLALILGGFGVAHLLQPEGRVISGLATRIRRITTNLSSVWPTVSPDGKMVAYLARQGGDSYDIWVQRIGGEAAIRAARGVAENVVEGGIAFSADGSKIYFPGASPSPGVYEVPVLGGEPRLVIPGGYNVQPSPDGKWLAYARVGDIYVIPVAGGDVRKVSPGSKCVWSPDSTRLLIARGWERSFQLVVFSLDGRKRGPDRPLAENLVRRGFGDLNLLRLYAWLPGDEIVFSARFGDATNLWRIPLANAGDAEPSPVTLAPWNNAMADVRGNRVVFANGRLTNQLWRLPANLNAGSVTGVPERVTPELAEIHFPDVRRDGSAAVYVSARDGGQGVFFLDLRSGKERPLALFEYGSAYTTFSADGSKVVFGHGGPRWPLFMVSAAGGPIQALGDSGGRTRGWSSDGRFVLLWRAYKSPDTVGVLDLTNGRIQDIIQSNLSIQYVRFSPDNRWITFSSLDGDSTARLWLAPFRGIDPIPTTDWIEIPGGGSLPFWSPDSRSFYYARGPSDNPSELSFMRQKLDSSGRPSGPPTEYYRFAGYSLAGPLLNTISVTREYVYLLLKTGQSDVWLMDLPR